MSGREPTLRDWGLEYVPSLSSLSAILAAGIPTHQIKSGVTWLTYAPTWAVQIANTRPDELPDSLANETHRRAVLTEILIAPTK